MNNELTLTSVYPSKMPNLERKKKCTLKVMKAKAEQAKLNLIYVELEEANIPFERTYNTVKELEKDLERNLTKVDFNKAKIKIDKIKSQIDDTLNELTIGSTNAFTKLMTSDLTKTISKSLGISLAGRTALLLAPTIETKAIIRLGIATSSLYKAIKNRNEIKKSNENNELNTILSELETTIENEKVTNTRLFP